MNKRLITGPMPLIRAKRPSPLMRLVKGRRSALDVLFERSYSMKMGQFAGLRRKYYFLAQPDIARRILDADPTIYPKSDLMSTFLSQILGDGIFVSNGATWKRQREMMNPAFQMARIAEVFPQMLSAAQDMRDRLLERSDAPQIAMDVEMTHVTADIIFRTIFSESLPRAEAEGVYAAFNRYQELAYVHGVWSMAGLPQALSLARLRARPHARAIRAPLEAMVKKRLACLDQDLGHAPADILSSLIAARDLKGVPFTNRELVDQVAVLFLAGHETSASVLSWALYLIARDLEVQRRLQAEADAVHGAEGGLAPRHLRQLKFTRDVFRETLRLYPPVSFVPRDITGPETIRGKALEPGSAIFVPIWLLHRHRSIWPNPDDFDPDRFARAEEKQAIREAYLPFSQGPRVCLGASFAMQEAVIILSMISHNFDISVCPDHTPCPVARLTLRSENGIRLKLSARKGLCLPE